MLPAIHRGNVGTLTPDDLMDAVQLFELVSAKTGL